MANLKVPETYPTIAAAVAAATAGDTITVAAGYAGNKIVTVTVDNLLFDAPSSVTGIVLTAGVGVATVRLSGTSDIQVTGNGAANVIVGNSGNNLLIGGPGNDQLDGGAGTDTASYASATAGVTVNLLTGKAADGQGGTDTLAAIENVRGSSLADKVTGDGGRNVLQGAEGNDRLYGGGGNDELYGDPGDDTINGDDGDDLMVGGTGNDRLDGGAGRDAVVYQDSTAGVMVNLLTGRATDGMGGTDKLTSVEGVFGSQYGDTLILGNTSGYAFGLAGNDRITGGTGDDEICGGAGNDRLDGGAGTDTASYASATAGVTVNLLTGKAADGQGGTDTLAAIENVRGSSLADKVTGDGGRNVLQGAEGNDRLYGGGGNDELYGDAGDDTINGDDGDDLMVGGAGNDRLNGGAGRDAAIYQDSAAAVKVNLLTGRAADGMGRTDKLTSVEGVFGSRYGDTLILGNTSGYAFGREGNDRITGGTGDDEIYGGAGKDILDGGGGNDTVSYLDDGNNGFDQNLVVGVTVYLAAGKAKDNTGNTDTLISIENVTGSSLADRLAGDAGRNILNGGQGDDRLIGDAGNDTLNGDDGLDTLQGGDGDDSLSGGASNDRIDGGAGRDVVFYENAAAHVSVNLLTGRAVDGMGGIDKLTNIEGVTGSRYSDSLTLGNVAGFAYGRAGNDTLTGGSANDDLYGGSGADRLDGAAGIDTANYFDDGLDTAGVSSAGVTVNLATGTAKDNWRKADTLTGIENVTGSSLADSITGDGNRNILSGGLGNDVLKGAAGDDRLIGGAGNDTLNGGSGRDLAIYEDATQKVTVNLATGVATDGHGGTDTLASIEGVVGSRYADTLTLGAVGGLAVGRAGGDRITGGAANDALQGGSGNDTLNGGAGIDTAVYLDDGFDSAGVSVRGVTVDLAAGKATDNWGGTDTLSRIENVSGSAFGDTLSGNSAANLLDGLAGADRLDGGAGADILKGGAGADTFAFTTALGGGNIDALADFVSGTDHIELSKAVFNALGRGALSAAFFAQAIAATTANQHILYNATTGVVSYDADGNGSGQALAFATLNPGQTLTAGDFKVV